eukprot:TRINITY_DN31252_c0_g1_i1.p1 TRINITY_DN31252_c0_g1~~TRINITY_DN31252_c0_g1_i1.p1  ORF type:complete len:185 (-),score=33.96 TRINITY_DN31252_c0_g1_i1:115-603(-)
MDSNAPSWFESAFRNAINEINTNVDTRITNSMNQLGGQINSLTTAVGDLQSKSSGMQSEITKQGEAVSSLQSQVQALQTKSTVLESKIEENRQNSGQSSTDAPSSSESSRVAASGSIQRVLSESVDKTVLVIGGWKPHTLKQLMFDDVKKLLGRMPSAPRVL